jgi:uncharacterized protein YeaO (DUF488 family)
MILIKRAYEDPAPDDGFRYLVDRFWPRGVRKETLQLDGWLKDVAPSAELCCWFGHEPDKWQAFRQRYFAELEAHPQDWQPLLESARSGRLTLVYGAKDTQHNNALALEDFLIAHLE